MQGIEPIVNKVIDVLKARAGALLPAGSVEFVDYGKTWTGVVNNFPSVFVMGARTAFNPDSQQLYHQAHTITVKFAVSGGEPDDLAVAAFTYMRAIDQALNASWPGDWNGVLAQGNVLRLFVSGHDYGPLFERGQALARFPELELVIETAEM